jgi:hypothetical protein
VFRISSLLGAVALAALAAGSAARANPAAPPAKAVPPSQPIARSAAVPLAAGPYSANAKTGASLDSVKNPALQQPGAAGVLNVGNGLGGDVARPSPSPDPSPSPSPGDGNGNGNGNGSCFCIGKDCCNTAPKPKDRDNPKKRIPLGLNALAPGQGVAQVQSVGR